MRNREALLESAITSLQEKGYAGTTARDVADRAGASLGAIGYPFGTVQELLDAALAEAVRRWFEPLIGLVSRPQPPPTFEQLAGIQSLLAGQPESASPDPQAAASLVMATFDGLILQWLLAPEQIPSGRVIADTLRRTAALSTVSAESIDAV